MCRSVRFGNSSLLFELMATVGRRVWVSFSALCQLGSYGILVDVLATYVELLTASNPVIGEASLPDGNFRVHAMGEATLDQANRSLKRDALGRQQEVNVVRHDHKRVEQVVPFRSIMLKCVEE